MGKSIVLLACLLLSAPRARAAAPPAAKESAPEAVDVITPLNVRDPSALVMRPGGQPVNLSVMAPSRAPETGALEAKAAKSAVDKVGL